MRTVFRLILRATTASSASSRRLNLPSAARRTIRGQLRPATRLRLQLGHETVVESKVSAYGEILMSVDGEERKVPYGNGFVLKCQSVKREENKVPHQDAGPKPSVGFSGGFDEKRGLNSLANVWFLRFRRKISYGCSTS